MQHGKGKKFQTRKSSYLTPHRGLASSFFD
jgi:hypothetical protein